MIKFQNFTKKYPGGISALEKIKLEIPKGDFVFLIGSSGAGKTTLLNSLIGEIKPTSGRVLLEDKDVAHLVEKDVAKLRRKVRMIFQDFKILFDRTVLENVLLALRILGRTESESLYEAKKVLKLVGLEDKLNYFPVQISAGELQRVAIARALAGGPLVLLADEPTGNLDPKTAMEIGALLEKINKTGTTVIVATHNAAFVDKIKKRVISLEKGRIIKDEKNGKYE